jgi:ADP-heptose:LPS heptosyltransferase
VKGIFAMPVKQKYPRPQAGDNILWIRFSAFGDVLQAAAAAQRFKMKYPGVHMTLLTQPRYADILQIQPYIDELLLWDNRNRQLDFFKVARKIRESNFKWLVSMHRVGAAAFIALFSGIERRYGYNSGVQFCYKATHWDILDDLDVDFQNRDIKSIFTSEEDRKKASEMLSGLPQKKLFAIIGASNPKKCWPVRYWIDFLSSLAAEGWGIILDGHSKEEEQTAREIEEAVSSPSVLNLVWKTSFPMMAAVAEASTCAAGNDTGPLHLAALAGTPTLGFFGVTDARHVNFRMPWFREVRVSCPSAGCWDYSCPLDCMADISPGRALCAFRKFMSEIQ